MKCQQRFQNDMRTVWTTSLKGRTFRNFPVKDNGGFRAPLLRRGAPGLLEALWTATGS